MSKEKKITVKYYLNKDAKPTYFEVKANACFPLYMRIIFNKKSTKIKVLDKSGSSVYLEDSKHGELTKKGIEGILKSRFEPIYGDPKIISKIIKNEFELFKDRFTLKGFGDRLAHFNIPLSYLVILPDVREYDRYVKDKFKLLDLESEEKYDLLVFIQEKILDYYSHHYVINKLLPDVSEGMPEEMRIVMLSKILLEVFAKRKELSSKGTHSAKFTPYTWFFLDGLNEFTNFLNSISLKKEIIKERESVQESLLSLKFVKEDIPKCIRYISKIASVGTL